MRLSASWYTVLKACLPPQRRMLLHAPFQHSSRDVQNSAKDAADSETRAGTEIRRAPTKTDKSPILDILTLRITTTLLIPLLLCTAPLIGIHFHSLPAASDPCELWEGTCHHQSKTRHLEPKKKVKAERHLSSKQLVRRWHQLQPPKSYTLVPHAHVPLTHPHLHTHTHRRTPFSAQPPPPPEQLLPPLLSQHHPSQHISLLYFLF